MPLYFRRGIQLRQNCNGDHIAHILINLWRELLARYLFIKGSCIDADQATCTSACACVYTLGRRPLSQIPLVESENGPNSQYTHFLGVAFLR